MVVVVLAGSLDAARNGRRPELPRPHLQVVAPPPAAIFFPTVGHRCKSRRRRSALSRPFERTSVRPWPLTCRPPAVQIGREWCASLARPADLLARLHRA